MRLTPHSRFLVSASITLVALFARSSLALTQPDGSPIPYQSELQSIFDSRGENIDTLTAALTVPETFVPGCKLEFEVLARNASYQNSFGWYNVTGAKPADSDLHEFLTCTDDVGTKKTLSIKQDPAYLGGEIGFYQSVGDCATTSDYLHIFYSEKHYNPDSDEQNPFIHLLIYNSTAVDKAFYFGWEDLITGGDNDFDDLATFVTGISCSDGGGACETGQLGVCAKGTMQCQQGQLECLPLVLPSDEKCDAIDNDCNGEVDDGYLCAAGFVCDKGTCVPSCSGGEFTCVGDQVCSESGYCVDPECITAVCPAEQKCIKGVCVGPCDGVQCPFGQICLVGACKDPCTLFACDAEQVCVGGACVERCQCAGCAESETCEPNGACIPTACVDKECGPGKHCDPQGQCVDSCLGAVCPSGLVCVAGTCTPDTSSGGGAGGMTLADGGAAHGGSASSIGGAGVSSSASLGSAPSGVTETTGCSCRIGGADENERGLWLLSVVALFCASRFRRAPRQNALRN